jgi:hypothetical protein
MVMELMEKWDVSKEEITPEKAKAVYAAVKQFIQNTEFSAPLYKPNY